MPGTMTTIDAKDTDHTAFAVPLDRLLQITRVQINNLANEDIRVRGWDTFTDTDGTVHTTIANEVQLFDYPVASQDGVVVDCGKESKRVMGTLVLQAYAAGAGIQVATPVMVYVGGEYPF